MEKRIKDRYNDDILREALQRYGIAQDRIRLLDGFESFMYEFERDDGQYILRLGHSLRRSIPMIQGEVNWINYLSDGGVPAARAILSENHKLVELVDDGQGEHFLATAFVRARGGHPKRSDWTPRFYEAYGALLGRMHALSKRYVPDAATWRPQWDDPINADIEQFLPPAEAVALDKHRAVMAHLRALPKDAESYGLIHQDAHTGNLFVDQDGSITLFDFDDCVYSWFIYDMAMVLFYAAPFDPEGAVSLAREFMPAFLRGYQSQHRLDAAWLQELPWFLKLREIDLYAIIHRSFDVNDIQDSWVARFMADRKRRIENDVPFIDFDWESLAEHL
jgi:Ser/Thr protein kinase RdoA (MazF antagonist)